MGKGMERAAQFFDIPAETLPNVPKLTVTGSRSIVVENHRYIKLFSGELIEIDCGEKTLNLHGSDFILERLGAGEVKIHGELLYAEFS